MELLEERSRKAPVAIAVEDVQWADPGTLAVLAAVAQRLSELAIALVISCRPVPRDDEVAELLRTLGAEGATNLTLPALSETEVAELATRLIGTDPGPNLRRQLDAAGGNPLFVAEMIAALAGQGAIRQGEDGDAEIEAGIGVPRSVGLTILQRLSFLPRETLDLLGLASVLGSSWRIDDLARLAGVTPGALAAPLRESIRAGILDGDDTRMAFRHELIREALYQDVPPALRGALHMDVARALTRVDAPPESVVDHVVRGAAPAMPKRSLSCREQRATRPLVLPTSPSTSSSARSG
jgi:predicted ATPase